jgi:hypothetical protein
MAVRTVSGYPHIQFFTKDDTVKTPSHTYDDPYTVHNRWPVPLTKGYLERMNYDNVHLILELKEDERLCIVFKEPECGDEYIAFHRKAPAKISKWFSPYSWFW